MILRRATLLLAVALVVSACGGGMTGVPTPGPTPAPGGIGTVAGTAAAHATALPVVGPVRRAGPAGPVRPVRRTAGRPVYIPGQLVVKFRAGAPAASVSALHTQVGASLVSTIDRLGVHVIRLAAGADQDAAMSAYRASPIVEYVERDAYAYATAAVTPNDPFYVPDQSWHYGMINLATAWNVTTGSAAVIVAVLDTGIRDDHPDLIGITSGTSSHNFFNNADNGNYRDPGCPSDPRDLSHGTHVSGTIAALTNNNQGVAGVNWGGAAGTKIMTLRVLGEHLPAFPCGSGSFSDIARAIMYAADHGAKVISMSFGGGGPDPTVDSAILYAFNLGVTLVAAAGNDTCSPPNSVEYPASNPNVIAVAAVGPGPAHAGYSSCGPEVAVASPGGDGSCDPGCFVWSTTWSPNTGFVYAGFQGTSMATPHVSGVVALMLSRGITGPANIRSILQSTASCTGLASCPGIQYGAGVIDAGLAVGAAANAGRLCAFTGSISGTTITRQSPNPAPHLQDNGAFTIPNAPSGTWSVFIWQDVNNNGMVDTGDAYGRRDNVAIFQNVTNTLTSAMQVQTYGTGALVGAPILSVPGGATCP